MPGPALSPSGGPGTAVAGLGSEQCGLSWEAGGREAGLKHMQEVGVEGWVSGTRVCPAQSNQEGFPERCRIPGTGRPPFSREGHPQASAAPNTRGDLTFQSLS